MATTNPSQEIAAQIIALMETGTAPWSRSWISKNPENALTRKGYRGVNFWWLLVRQIQMGYTSPLWVTYKQAQTMGGNVRAGEKSTKIVFWATVKREDPETGETKVFPAPRVYLVFNVEQCDGLTIPEVKANPDQKPDENAEKIVSSYLTLGGPTLRMGGDPLYFPQTDTITCPPISDFKSVGEYYAALFHEMAHSTGHVTRLDRDLGALKGSHEYSKEELVAEIAAAMLCHEAGVGSPELTENHAAYCRGWARRLKADPQMLLSAISASQKAVDEIKGVSWANSAGEQAEAA